MSVFSNRAKVLALLFSTLVGTQAAAQSFSPYKCSTCPTMTNVKWTYQIGMNHTGTELPLDPNCAGSPTNPCPHYINWTDHTRFITGNGYIKQVGLNFASFDTEPVNDSFTFGEIGGATTTLSGALAPGWRDVTVSGSLQTTPVATFFDTDDSVTHQGINISAGRVCCGGTEVPGVIDVEPHLRYTGFLLASNDVVHYRVPTTDASIHTTIAMWAYPRNPTEPVFPAKYVDVYVRCNQPPTPATWDYRKARNTLQEFIHIPEGVSPPSCNGHWYIAVAARGGANTFNLVVAQHQEAQHRKLKVGFQQSIPPAFELNLYANALSQATKYFYGATEGTHFFDTVEIYTDAIYCLQYPICGGEFCDVCYLQTTGRSSATACGGPGTFIRMRDGGSSWQIIAHEMGHQFFCVRDEYYENPIGPNCNQCGHTHMANLGGTQNNFCYGHTLGSLENHGKDGDPGCPATPHPPGWQVAYDNGVTPWLPSETPDNYPYTSFDFEGQVGSVVIY